MNYKPPRWADRFLAWYCNPDLLEEIQGDLYEIHDEKCAAGKPKLARFLFVWYVLRSFRYDVIRRNNKYKNSIFMMTRNNFKIAFRVLWRDWFNTALSMGGLAIGITCFLLMGFYVKQEVSFDHFHSKKDRIYRVWLKEDYGDNKVFFNSVTPLRFEELLEDDFSEIETAIQFNINNYLVGKGDDRNNENVAIISPELFSVFDFKILKGNPAKPLPELNDVILSASYANKYFGDEDPIGKSMGIQIGEEIRDFNVSAVFADIRKESSIQFDMAISNENNKNIYGERAMKAWFNVSQETYVLVGENSHISAVEEKIPDVVMGYLKGSVEEGVYNIGFQPLTDIHLNPDIPLGIAPVGNRDYVYILAVISVLVLVIACINYTTLSVGQSLKRSKEVGVRKVMGAFKSSLINQYLSESLVIAFFATVIGIALANLLLPIFNDLTNADVKLGFELWHIILYLGLVLIIGISSGIYPAFILSRLRITAILKGNNQASRNHYIRKGMVVFQFVVTVFLISSTLIMRQQLNYLHTKDLGFNYNATVSVPLYPDPSANRLSQLIVTAMEKGEILKEKLSQYPDIQDIGLGSHVFGSSGWGRLAFTDDAEVFRRFRLLVVDPYYFNTFHIKMKEGRAFDPKSDLDKRQSIIVNQAAVDYFGLDEPLGNRLPSKRFDDHAIIGVTENFNYSSLHSAVEPLVITQNVAIPYSGISDHGYADSPIPKLVFRYTGSQLSQVKQILNKEWENTFPEEDLNFDFVEENMRYQYANEDRLNRLVMISTILSIIIASLGLLGLTVLVVNSRTKEIGIRKVIGASELTIFKLLAKSFSLQLLLGIVLSIPVTYWLMKDWLSGFAYQIDIGIGIFTLSAVISIIVALTVISFHTIKASKTNPVNSLRSE
ncbi:ABC transporter permease [Fulvivirgaceae bacterium BMA10]|uniref:ABC transporter permease n=1 Tax=Splendidivirga corallicola TaxID=3051826 RepID=A0ABT8KP16_9BACT|nr:ABC transporter permease [Fulvivirgaceae bacterium BMA10]